MEQDAPRNSHPERLLCFSPYTTAPDCASTEASLLHGMAARGCEVRHVLCDGMPTCDLYTAKEPRAQNACVQCQAAAAVQAHFSGTSFHWFSRYQDPREATLAADWAAQVPDADLVTAKHGDWEIGRWVNHSVRRHLMGTASFESPTGRAAYRQHLEVGLRTAFAFERLLDDVQPTSLLVYEGRGAPLRVAREMFLARSGRVFAHEIIDDGRLLITELSKPEIALRRRCWIFDTPQAAGGPARPLTLEEVSPGADAALDQICSVLAREDVIEPNLALDPMTQRPVLSPRETPAPTVSTAVRDQSPWPLAPGPKHRFLAWPDYRDTTELELLVDVFGRQLVGQSDAQLCLRRDPILDPPHDECVAMLAELHQRLLGESTDLSVLIVDESVPEGQVHRLGLAMEAGIELPSSLREDRSGFINALELPLLRRGEELRQLLRLSVRQPEPSRTVAVAAQGASTPGFWSPAGTVQTTAQT